jgi:hypothetical protein
MDLCLPLRSLQRCTSLVESARPRRVVLEEDISTIVASNEGITIGSRQLAVYVLLRLLERNVHVTID